MGRMLFWFVLSIGITIIGTLLLWHFVGPYAFFGFLFLPFLFGLSGWGRHDRTGEAARSCPRCGYKTMDPRDRYCPRDGQSLG
jgi:hypothetical protein